MTRVMRMRPASQLRRQLAFVLLVVLASASLTAAGALYSWSTPTMVGTPSGRSGVAATTFNNTLFVQGGGSSSSDDIYQLDLASMTWTLRPDGSPTANGTLPAASSDHYILVFNDTLMLTNVEEDKVWHLDLVTNSWSRKYAALLDIQGATAVLYQDVVYQFGGNSFLGNPIDNLFEYRPGIDIGLTDPWNDVDKTIDDDWPDRRTGHSMVLYDAQLWVFGGLRKSPVRTDNELWWYNLDTGIWTYVSQSGDWPDARQQHTAVVGGHSMFVHGGMDHNDPATATFFDDVWQWSFRDSVWREISTSGTAPAARRGHIAAIYDTHIYLMFGSQDDPASPFSDVFRLQWAADRVSFTEVVANDPDDADAVYGNGDTITLCFAEATNTPPVASKAQVDALFAFTPSIGNDYYGTWANATALVLTITDVGATADPGIGTLTVQIISADLQDFDETSPESSDVSPTLTGDWGTAEGPAILSVTGNDPDDADGIYSNGDTLLVAFATATNAPAVASKAQLDALFTFSASLGTTYTGAWQAGNTQVLISITDVAGHGSPELGAFTLSVKASADLRDAALTTLASASVSPALAGDWGLLAGPSIVSVVADDTDDADGVFSTGDTLLLTFSEATNQVGTLGKIATDSLFAFSHSLGTDYTATWQAGGVECLLTILNAAGHGSPPLTPAGAFNITVLAAGEVRNAAATSLPSTDVSPALTGDWGLLPGPEITSFTADDPNDTDGIYSAADTLTLVFDMPTDAPALATRADVDTLLSFSAALGADYTATWTSTDTLVINITDATGAAPPAVGVLTVTVQTGGAIELRNAASSSLASTSTSPVLTGDFGTLAGPVMTSLVADDPDDADGAWSDGDTITLSFDQATDQPDVSSGAAIAALLDFSAPLTGSTLSAVWTAPDTLTLTVDVAGGFEPGLADRGAGGGGAPGVWNVTLIGTVRNAAATSQPSPIGSVSPNLVGDWGTLAGPSILSVVVNDPDDADAIISADDTLLITFSEATNTPDASSAAALDAWMQWSTSLGSARSGVWQASNTQLLITLSDVTGHGSPTIGVDTVTLLDTAIADNTALLRNAAQTSRASVATSPTLTGDWGTLAGPSIVSIVADDPDNQDSDYSIGDTLTVTFSEATNTPAVASTADLDTLLAWSDDIGASYTGVWASATQLVVAITDVAGAAPPTVSSTTVTVQAGGDLRNAASSSLPSTATSPVLTGSFGNGPLCNFTSCVDCLTTSNDCLWCSSTSSCVDGTAAGGPLYVACPQWSDVDCPSCNYTTCETCGYDDACGWCRDTDECIEGTAASPALASCNDWMYKTCPGPQFSAISADPTEAGGAGTFNVQLSRAPSATVVLDIGASDASEGTTSPPSVTFSTANWNITQLVTVTGVDDSIDDGDVDWSVTFIGSSTDPGYAGIHGPNMTVTTIDDDGALIVATPVGGTAISEAGGSSVLSVVLNTQPLDAVTVTLATSDASEGTVSLSPLVFDDTNWNVVKQVNVLAVDDPDDDGDIAWTLQLTGASAGDAVYDGMQTLVGYTTLDDDTSGISISIAPGSPATATSEDASAPDVWLDVVLTARPVSGSVTVALGLNNTAEMTIAPSGLTWNTTTWDTPQRVTLSGRDDVVDDGDAPVIVSARVVAAGDPAYSALDSNDLLVYNMDDDTAQLRMSHAALAVTEQGSPATFTIVMDTQPVGDVIVPIASADATEVAVSPGSVTFTPGTWDQARTVTVSPVADWQVDGDQTTAVTFGPTTALNDAPYDNITPTNLVVTVADVDVAGIDVAPRTGIVTGEDGTWDTFSVALTSMPSDDVTLTLGVSDASEGAINTTMLVFTPATWNTRQVVRVTGVDDLVTDADAAYSISLGSAVSNDAQYNGLSGGLVTCINVNDEVPSVVVTPNTATVRENGPSVTLAVRLGAPPNADVSVPGIGSVDVGEVVAQPSVLTFTPANWYTTQNLTLLPIDDNIIDGDINVQVVLGPTTSSDAAFQALAVPPVLVIVQDDDVPGLSVFSQTGTVTEPGGQVVLRVVLSAMPQGSGLNQVAVAVDVDDATEATVSPSNLVFTDANWNSPQDIIVTGVDDFVSDGDILFHVNATITSADDTLFQDHVLSVPLMCIDDDAAAVVTSLRTGVTSEDGTSVAFTMHLGSQPVATVTVPMTSSDVSEGFVFPSSMTFTPANWFVAQPARIIGTDDDVADGDQPYAILLGPCVSVDVEYAALDGGNVTLVNMDNDEATIDVTGIDGTTTEAGGTASFTVVLGAAPTQTVNIPLHSTDTSEGVVAPTLLTFTPTTWDTPITVTVTGVDDDVQDQTQTFQIVLEPAITADPVFVGLRGPNVTVSNVDDDNAGLLITDLVPETTEAGGQGGFRIALTSEPTDTVEVELTSMNPAEGTVNPDKVVFTPATWRTAVAITVTGVDDDIDDDDQTYSIQTLVTSLNDPFYHRVDDPDLLPLLTFTNLDDDTAGLATSPVAMVTKESGSLDFLTWQFDSEPRTVVQVAFAVSDASEGDVSHAVMLKTPTSWDTPSVLTVTGLQDTPPELDGATWYRVLLGPTVSDDAKYSDLTAFVPVCNMDIDDPNPVQVSPASGDTVEDGTQQYVFVVMNSAPASGVSVVLSVSSSNTAEVAVSPATLTFTQFDWDVPQLITLTGVNDDVDDGDQPVTVTVASTAGLVPAQTFPVPLLNIDDDVAAVVFGTPTGQVSEAGSSAFVPVQLGSEPTATVTVHLRVSDASEALLRSPSVLTFTPATWATPQVVQVQGVQDDLDNDGDRAFLLQAYRIVSADAVYNALPVSSVQLLNLNVVAPAIERISPTVLSMDGGPLLTFGKGFRVGLDLSISDTPITNVTLLLAGGGSVQARAVAARAAGNQQADVMSFVAPPQLAPGYHTLLINNADGTQFVLEDEVFYTSDCPTENTFGLGESCSECPPGATCPGGYRLWPNPGYWNPGEEAGFVHQCSPPNRCLGGRENACSYKYQGEFCGECVDSAYRAIDGTCRFCDGNGYTAAAVVLYISACVAVVGMLAACEGHMVSHITTALVGMSFVRVTMLQTFWPMPWYLKDWFSFMGLLTLDPTFLRLGCDFGQAEATAAFAGSLLVLILLSLLLVAVVWALYNIGKFGLMDYEDAQNRVIRGLVCINIIFYLTMTYYTFQSLHCVRTPDTKLRLAAQLSVECYVDSDHIAAAVFAWPMLLLHGIAFPAVAGYFLYTFESELDLAAAKLTVGPLYRQFENDYSLAGVGSLAALWVLALLASVGTETPIVQFVLSLAVIGGILWFLLAAWPYKQFYETGMMALTMGFCLLALCINFSHHEDWLVPKPLRIGSEVVYFATYALLLLAWIGWLVSHAMGYELHLSANGLRPHRRGPKFTKSLSRRHLASNYSSTTTLTTQRSAVTLGGHASTASLGTLSNSMSVVHFTGSAAPGSGHPYDVYAAPPLAREDGARARRERRRRHQDTLAASNSLASMASMSTSGSTEGQPVARFTDDAALPVSRRRRRRRERENDTALSREVSRPDLADYPAITTPTPIPILGRTNSSLAEYAQANPHAHQEVLRLYEGELALINEMIERADPTTVEEQQRLEQYRAAVPQLRSTLSTLSRRSSEIDLAQREADDDSRRV